MIQGQAQTLAVTNMDIWAYEALDTAIIIPTNGCTMSNKHAVMGAGLALQAKERYPNLPQELGARLLDVGNHVQYFHESRIIAFPTKDDWRKLSTWDLVMQSADELVLFWQYQQLVPDAGIEKFVCPKVGCGHGKLNWKFVRQGLEEIWTKAGILDRISFVE